METLIRGCVLRRALRPASLVILFVTAVALTAGQAGAHHGKDFLLVESYDLPHPKEVFLVSNQDWVRQRGENEFSLTPALFFGVVERLAVELHGHTAKAGSESFRYESTAPAVHYQITPPGSPSPWKVGISAEYEIANRSGRSEDIEAEEEEPAELQAAEARSAPSRHEGESHGEETAEEPDHAGDRFATRLIFARFQGMSNLTFNLITAWERGNSGTDWGYAVGYRPDMSGRFSWGVEAQGPLDSGDGHEALIGVYGEPSERLVLKFGVGTGIGRDRTDVTARTGVVWRF